MKVLHIVSGDLWAGAEVQVAQLLRALAAGRATEVAAFVLNDGELVRRLRAADVTVFHAQEGKLGFAQLVRRLVQAFDEFRPQLVHSHRYKEHVLATALRCFRKVPLVRTVHGAPETQIAAHDLRRRAIRVLDRWCARRESACIVVSRDLANKVSVTLRPPRLELIPNSVDLEQLDNELNGSSQAGERRGARRIGIVGRLVPVKRVDLFLEVARQIAAKHPQVEFVIVGDGPLRDTLAQRVTELKLDQRVRMTGAVQPIAPLMSTLDVLLITSDHEGLPSVLLEALALGVAVVSRAVGGIPEVVEDGKSALLVASADASALTEQVERLLADEALHTALTCEGRRIVTESYSSRGAAERHRALYDSILQAT